MPSIRLLLHQAVAACNTFFLKLQHGLLDPNNPQDLHAHAYVSDVATSCLIIQLGFLTILQALI